MKKYLTPIEQTLAALTNLQEEFDKKKEALTEEASLRQLIIRAVGDVLQPKSHIDWSRMINTSHVTPVSFGWDFSGHDKPFTRADVVVILTAFPPLPLCLADDHYYAASPKPVFAQDQLLKERPKYTFEPIGDLFAKISPNGYGMAPATTKFTWYARLGEVLCEFSINVNMHGSVGYITSLSGPADTYKDPRFTRATGMPDDISARMGYWGNSNDERRRLPEYEVIFGTTPRTPEDWAALMLPEGKLKQSSL